MERKHSDEEKNDRAMMPHHAEAYGNLFCIVQQWMSEALSIHFMMNLVLCSFMHLTFSQVSIPHKAQGHSHQL